MLAGIFLLTNCGKSKAMPKISANYQSSGHCGGGHTLGVTSGWELLHQITPDRDF